MQGEDRSWEDHPAPTHAPPSLPAGAGSQGWTVIETWRWSEPTPSGGLREHWQGATLRCNATGHKKDDANHKFLGTH